MIVVWDNGMSYSDHTLHFIDVGDGPLAAQRLAWLCKLACTGYAVCAAPTADWFKGKPMSWADWAQTYAEHEVTCEREYQYGPKPCTCWIAEAGLGDL